jgi:hypothetical protein
MERQNRAGPLPWRVHLRSRMLFLRYRPGAGCEGIQELLTTKPRRAVALCEAFLAGCHAKAEQLDDSSDNFGMFVKDLICLWIKARQADGAESDETATLLAWMDDDP